METRRDYRKLMNIKKRNKNYAKGIVLASLGLGIGLANSTTAHAESREWKANTSTTIKSGDTEYKIVWGDTLSLISKDSGLTIETLTKLNNILDANLIYEGNVLVFGNGATAIVKDENGNVIAETPLTTEDTQGIKEAQNNTATNNTTNVNSSSSAKNNNGTTTNTNNSTGNNNGVINTVKPTKPTENGGNTTNPVNPVQPVDPTNPTNPIDPVKPQEKEYVITINHITEDGEVLSKETRKAKANTEVIATALDFSDRNYEIIGESTQTINVKEDTTITFKYKKIDNTKPEVEKVSVEIKHTGDDGKVLSTETIIAEKDSIVKATAKDFTGLGYVLNDEITKEIKASEGAVIEFSYRKVTEEKEFFEQTIFFVDVDDEDLVFDPVLVEMEVLLNTHGVLKGQFKISDLDVPEGYELTGEQEDLQTTYSSQPSHLVFIKKVEDTKPVEPTEETIESVVSYVENGVEISSQLVDVTLDKDGNGKVTAEVPEGFELVGDATQVVTKANPNVSFEVKRIEETPVDPEKETVDLEVYYVAGNDLVFTDNVTVELGEQGTGTVEANVPSGYELVGDSKVTVTKDTPFVSFEVKSTTPIQEKTNVQTIYNLVDADGNFVETLEVMDTEWEIGKEMTVEANAKYGTYDLVSEASITQTVQQGTQFVFNYRDNSTPVDPVDPEPTGEVNVAIDFILVDENGQFVETLQHMPFTWLDGEELSWTADAMWGDAKLISPQTQTIIASEGAVMTFKYQKDFTPERPQWTFGIGEIETGRDEVDNWDNQIGNSGYTFLTHAEADNFGAVNVWAWAYDNGLEESQSQSWSVFSVSMKDGTTRYTTHFNGY